jgi:hypothetical protein
VRGDRTLFCARRFAATRAFAAGTIDLRFWVKNDHVERDRLQNHQNQRDKICKTGLAKLKNRAKTCGFERMKRNSASFRCIELFERNARVLMRFFIQICARRTRLARAKHVH